MPRLGGERAAGQSCTLISSCLQEGRTSRFWVRNGAGKIDAREADHQEVMPLYREQPPVKFNGDPRATLVDARKTLATVSSTMQAQINVHLPAVDIVEGGLFLARSAFRATSTRDERTHAKAP